MRPALAAAALVLLLAPAWGGCAPSPSGEGARVVWLTISLPGGEAAPAALCARIRSRLDERGIGAFAGTSSTGPGRVALGFRVTDAGRARRAMEVVMAAEAKGLAYEVTTVEESGS